MNDDVVAAAVAVIPPLPVGRVERATERQRERERERTRTLRYGIGVGVTVNGGLVVGTIGERLVAA